MLKIVTFNCHSIKQNEYNVRELLKSNDVVMLQELMIYQCDTFIFDNLNNEFNHVICVKDNTIKKSCHFLYYI